MNETTRTEKEEGAREPRFHNRLYHAEVGRTPAGSPGLKIAPTNPKGRYAQHRQMAAFIYELAAEMERRSEDLGARWAISPYPMEARIVVELSAEDEVALARDFITNVANDFDLL